MHEVVLKVQKRSIPSKGRARAHESVLEDLGIEAGSRVEIINNETEKSIDAGLFGDSIVEIGYIRLSEEDIAAIDIKEDATVIVRKKPHITEKLKKSATETGESISKGVDELGESVKGAGKGVKEGATKAYEKVAEGVAPIGEKIGGLTKGDKEKKKS
jgi:bifunctional DNA-binding transcriptional regulator/antitoxin component of YhaV-PrlF toxin-antitoxin module